MEFDNSGGGGGEDFGLPCPPWEDYAAAAAFDNNDHHYIINLQPDTFFDGLNEDDDDVGTIDDHVICSKEVKVQSKSCIIKHGRGKELRTTIRVLKPTANQLAAACQLLDKKKKDNATTSRNILDDQPKKVLMMNKKDTSSINLDQPNKKLVLVATKVTKMTTTTSPNSMPKHLNNNNNIGPKDDQKVLPRDESSMQLKFESAKRKLHDSYQRINNSKKHRSIQVIEFQKPPLPLPNPKARRTSYRAKYPHQPAAILQH